MEYEEDTWSSVTKDDFKVTPKFSIRKCTVTAREYDPGQQVASP